MEKEKCKECKGTLVLNEESLCVHCELALGGNYGNTPSVDCEEKYGKSLSVDCGICKVIVKEDSQGLFCDVCRSWFHNDCNETPLNFELYTLLNKAPNNVKWFCDKCIWETELWITKVNNKHKRPKRVRKSMKIVNEFSDEAGKETVLNNEIKDEEVIKVKQKKKRINKTSVRKLFSCEVCNKKFKASKARQRHMISQHATEKPFECTECDKKYADRNILEKHKLTHIPNEERPHACDQCDLRFNHKAHLKNHKEIHTGALKVFCDICGRGFRNERDLKRHIMIHNDEKPLKCEICGKGFRHSGNLSRHINSHKKIVCARCPICGFGAPTKYVLNRHIKQVHTNETPFECDVCGNKYKTNGNLSKHKRGIRGSCKGFNLSDSSIQKKQKPNTSDRPYYEQDKHKQEVSPILLQEAYNSTAQMPAMQSHYNHSPLLLYGNSHNSNVYASQYHGSLILPNSRGLTAELQKFAP